MKLIAIDPGITKTGIVYGEYEPLGPLNIKSIDYVNKSKTWWYTLEHIRDSLDEQARNNLGKDAFDYEGQCWEGEIHFAVEFPVVFRAVGKSITNQMMFVGCILEFIRHRFIDATIYLVYPTTAKLALTGKGNAKKPDMVKIAEINYPGIRWITFLNSTKETIADAIGIGLAVTKKLNGVTRLE